MSLREAREKLQPLAEHGGTDCPACAQMVRVYSRKLTSVPVRALVGLYVDYALEYGHLPTVAENHLAGQAHQGGYLALAAHWSLMEDERHRRPDGGKAGIWRVTALGEQWLLGDTTVPMYARVYNGRCLGLTGDPVSIADVLGGKFNLSELIASSAAERGEPIPLFVDREAA